MARERMVTRTVELSVCEVMCMDVSTAEVIIEVYEIGGGINDKDALLKAIKRTYETPTFKCVAVSNVTTKQILYGMPESEFIAKAKILPNRGTKSLEN